MKRCAGCPWLAILAVLAVYVPPAVGFEARAVVFGVLLEKGNVVSGAEVQLGEITSQTNEAGEFLLEAVPGEHEVTIVPPGSDAVRYRVPVRVEAGKQQVRIDLAKWNPTYGTPRASDRWFAVHGLYGDLGAARAAVELVRARVGDDAEIRLANDGLYAVTVGAGASRDEAEASLARLPAGASGRRFVAPAAGWSESLELTDGSADEVAALVALLVSEGRSVRRSARRALSRIGQRAVDPLLAALEQRIYRVDLGVFEALGGMTSWSAPAERLESLRPVVGRYPREPVIQDSYRRAVGSYDWTGALGSLGFEGESAVQQYQNRAGLLADGIVGPQTQTSLLQTLRKSGDGAEAVRPSPRVFIHFTRREQLPRAEALAQRLRELEVAGAAVEVPPDFVRTTRAPSRNELRFLKSGDAAEAERIFRHLQPELAGLVLRDFSAVYDKVPNVRPRTYELWLGGKK